MNYPAILAGLKPILAACSGVPVGSVGPKDAGFRFPARGPQVRLDYQILGVVGLGVDVGKATYDPSAVIPGDTSGPGGSAALGGIVYTAQGDRVITLQVKVECGRQDTTAWAYAERCRTRLAFPSTRASLRLLGLGLQAPVGRSTPLHYHDENGHALSVVVFDAVLNAADVETDSPVTTIDQVQAGVEASSDLT